MNVRFRKSFYQEEHDPEGKGGTGGGGGGETDEQKAARLAGEEEAKKKAAEEEAKKKAKPTDEEARLLKENMKRKEKEAELSKELETLNASISALGGLDTLKKLIEDKKAADEKAMEAKGEWDRLKANLVEEGKKAVKVEKERADSLAAQLEAVKSQLMEATIGSEFAKSEYIKTEMLYTPNATRTLLGAHFDLVDGVVVGYDKPRGAAARTPLEDADGNPLSFEAAIAKIVDAHPEADHMKRSKAKSGADSGTQRNTPVTKTFASSRDRIAAAVPNLIKASQAVR